MVTALLAGSAVPCPAASPAVAKAVRSLADKLLRSDAAAGSAVAVRPFAVQGADVALGTIIADALAGEFVGSGRFTVIDRAYLSAPDRAPANLSAAAYVIRGGLAASGKKKLILQAELLAAATGPVLSSAKVSLRADEALPDALDGAGPASLIPGSGPNDCRWIESQASVPAADPASARAAALVAARARALLAVMSLPPSRTPDFSEDALRGKGEPVLRELRSGRVMEEKVQGDAMTEGRYGLVLRSCVNAAALSKDKGFWVELRVNGRRFFEGQTVLSEAVANRDGFVHLFLADLEGGLARLDPGQSASGPRVIAGRPFAAPAFPAALPKGGTSAVVVLRALAVRRDVSPIIEKALSYADLLRRLDEREEEWAEDVRILTVYPQPRP